MLDRYKSLMTFSQFRSNFQKKRIIGNGDYYFLNMPTVEVGQRGKELGDVTTIK